jgi:putative ABC transport system permease protein
MGQKYFGSESPLGKTLYLDGKKRSLQVTGVIADMPFNTHLHFDYLVSIPTFYNQVENIGQGALLENRTWAAVYTYVLLNKSRDRGIVESKFPDFLADFLAERGPREEILAHVSYHLQPITSIHLHSRLEQEMGANSSIAYVYIFSAIALFILLIAGVNFVNISTAQALTRMKEVGVRKLLGARKRQLIKQFLGESLLLTFAAAILAIQIFQISIPVYNTLAGKNLEFEQLFTLENALFIFALILTIGTLAGLYPGFFMSSFNPVNSIKGFRDPQSSAASLRKGLVVFQFAISIFMIFSTLVILQQMEFFRTKDLGFDKENLIAVKLHSDLQADLLRNPEAIKANLLSHAAISSVSLVSNLPGERFSVEPLIVEGKPGNREQPQLRFLRVDEDFVRTMNIQIIKGKSFREKSLNSPAFILNESAVKTLNLEEPVGRIASTYFRMRGEIYGIAKDFNYASLHNIIEPLAIEYVPANNDLRSIVIGYLLIKIRGKNIAQTLKFIKSTFSEIAADNLFIYSFIDDGLNRLYTAEDKMGNIFEAFALFAIFISCIGLFGLSAYSAQLRVKEVGIRKVLGASIPGIVVLLSKDFVKWVILANIIALPVAGFFMNHWLQNFAYRIDMIVWVFFLSGTIAILIAIATVSYQAIKAAIANPVESLRYE